MRNMKQYRQWKEDNPLLDMKLSEEKKITRLWYSKISGEMNWNPGERESLAKESDRVAMEIDHIIGWKEIRGSDLFNRDM